MFQKEFEYFKANQEDLVRQHEGKVLSIKGEKVIGVYNNALEAYIESSKDHKIGSFMIQPCKPGPEAYTVTISSSELIALKQDG